jgi:hypothetical protein
VPPFKLDEDAIRLRVVHAVDAAIREREPIVEAVATATLDALRSQIRAAVELAGIDTRDRDSLSDLLDLLITRACPTCRGKR